MGMRSECKAEGRGSTRESLRKVDRTSPESLRHRCLLSLMRLRRTPVCRNRQRTQSGNIMKTAFDRLLVFPKSLTYISGTL